MMFWLSTCCRGMVWVWIFEPPHPLGYAQILHKNPMRLGLGFQCQNTTLHLYPSIPLARNTQCYPYPCHSLKVAASVWRWGPACKGRGQHAKVGASMQRWGLTHMGVSIVLPQLQAGSFLKSIIAESTKMLKFCKVCNECSDKICPFITNLHHSQWILNKK